MKKFLTNDLFLHSPELSDDFKTPVKFSKSLDFSKEVSTRSFLNDESPVKSLLGSRVSSNFVLSIEKSIDENKSVNFIRHITSMVYKQYSSSCHTIQYLKTLNVSCRIPVLPGVLSENLAILLIHKLTGEIASRSTNKSGDLHLNGKTFEIKAFASEGPNTFTHCTKWDALYWFDMTKLVSTGYIKVYKTTETDWSHVQVSKSATYADKCREKKPIKLTLQKAVEGGINFDCVFSGYIDELI